MKEENVLIQELNSDLLQRNLKFWNSYKIQLFTNKIYVESRNLFGLNYQEKTIDLINLDSIYLSKNFNKKLLVIVLFTSPLAVLAGIFLYVFILDGITINIIPSTIALIITLSWLITLVLIFIGNKQFIIGSNNDKAKIYFLTVPRKDIDSFTLKALEQKSKIQLEEVTDVNINSSQQTNTKDSLESNLTKLKELLDLNLITKEEFKTKKSELLDKI